MYFSLSYLKNEELKCKYKCNGTNGSVNAPVINKEKVIWNIEKENIEDEKRLKFFGNVPPNKNKVCVLGDINTSKTSLKFAVIMLNINPIVITIYVVVIINSLVYVIYFIRGK